MSLTSRGPTKANKCFGCSAGLLLNRFYLEVGVPAVQFPDITSGWLGESSAAVRNGFSPPANASNASSPPNRASLSTPAWRVSFAEWPPLAYPERLRLLFIESKSAASLRSYLPGCIDTTRTR